MIFNLCSEREYAAEEFGGAVQRFPFDDHNPCPFNMIADFCASVDRWLGADKHNVVAVHCKAGKVLFSPCKRELLVLLSPLFSPTGAHRSDGRRLPVAQWIQADRSARTVVFR